MAKKPVVEPTAIVIGDLPFPIEPDRYYRVTFAKVVRIGGLICRPGIVYTLIGSRIEPLASSIATVEPV